MTVRIVDAPVPPGLVLVEAMDLYVWRPVDGVERAQRLAANPELRRITFVLAAAHELVIATSMPRCTERDLAAAVAPLDQWLERAEPHLRAWARDAA